MAIFLFDLAGLAFVRGFPFVYAVRNDAVDCVFSMCSAIGCWCWLWDGSGLVALVSLELVEALDDEVVDGFLFGKVRNGNVVMKLKLPSPTF